MADFDYWGLGASFNSYDFTNKKKAIKDYISYMLTRTMSMFEYNNLPDTMPKRAIELYSQVNGYCAVVEHEGNLYSLFGNWGGTPNEYYLPKEFIVSNPYLNLYKTYTIDVDCVMIRNDTLYTGLMPMFRRYASLMVENDISMRINSINSRIYSLLSAQDDNTRSSAIKYLEDVENGKIGVVASNILLESIKSQPYGDRSGNRLTDLIEYHQYLKASWFNDIGLQANYNMKRESINSDEAQLNDDMLSPLIDDMLACRQEDFNKVNAMFGTNITVDFSSAWKNNAIEIDTELDNLINQNIEGGENIDE